MRKFHPKFTRYSCDEDGNIYGIKGNLLMGCESSYGYRQYEFEGKTYFGHRFVWECFVGEIPDGKVINHLDHNKQNNNIENLEVTDTEKNVQYYYENIGIHLIKEVELSSRTVTRKTKLNKEQVRKIILLSLEGKTNRYLGELFGVHERYISLIRHKKRWQSVWLEMGLETSTTIPSGSRAKRPEVEGTRKSKDMV